MQTFYVVVKKRVLVVYEKKNNSFERVYIGGNPDYSYSVNCSKEHISRLINSLVEEYNLDSIGELDFVVIENEDSIISASVLGAFGQSISNVVKIEDLINKVSKNLGRDQKLHISEYGINYDEKRYLVRGNELLKEDFCLLSYSLSEDMLMRFIG